MPVGEVGRKTLWAVRLRAKTEGKKHTVYLAKAVPQAAFSFDLKHAMLFKSKEDAEAVVVMVEMEAPARPSVMLDVVKVIRRDR